MYILGVSWRCFESNKGWDTLWTLTGDYDTLFLLLPGAISHFK